MRKYLRPLMYKEFLYYMLSGWTIALSITTIIILCNAVNVGIDWNLGSSEWIAEIVVCSCLIGLGVIGLIDSIKQAKKRTVDSR